MSHAAVKSFDRRGISCKNARTVQFSGGVGGVEKCPVILLICYTLRTEMLYITEDPQEYCNRKTQKLLQLGFILDYDVNCSRLNKAQNCLCCVDFARKQAAIICFFYT